MDEKQAVNFNIVPDEERTPPGRVYSNFCAIQNSPFDFTLTFCEVLPLSEQDLQQARQNGNVKAPVRVRVAVPVQMIPGLIAALQENFRLFQQSVTPPPAQGGPMN
jgi:hypothetical protein